MVFGMNKIKRIRILLLFMVLPGSLLFSQGVDLLVSPGKLSKVHSQYAGIKNCSQCHSERKKADPLKCLACHKDLAERINAGRGYHKGKKADCVTCHPEHQGENFNLIEWNPKEFAHSETGYILTGLHKKIPACDKCHTALNAVPGKKTGTYLLKDNRCAACHKDYHKGQLGASCDKCHNTETPFKQTVFNHEKTKFPLKGAHIKVECAKCHKKNENENKWTGLRFSMCSDCHKNPHLPPFKQKCSDCHNENTWKTSAFNHDQTRFQLRGKHTALTCSKCHPAGEKNRKLAFANCTDCHKKDPHKGQFNKDCKSCHVVEGFEKVLYNHDTTRFPLTGKHIGVSCKKCHHYAAGDSKTIVYKPLGMACYDCHTDIHLKQFNKNCEACHSTAGFKREFLKFDHQKDSSYALQGKHTSLRCEKCHIKKKQEFPAGLGETVLYKPVSNKCTTCHDDFHLGQLDLDCQKCHGFDSFKPVKTFDHQKTRFSLKGFHETVACEKCHPKIRLSAGGKTIETVKYKPIGASCMECHKNFDHSRTAFPLVGKHLDLECRLCHNEKTPNTRKTKVSQKSIFDCTSCHISPHTGYRQNCTDCHNSKTWRVNPW
jgi:hypothetical protein